MVKSGASQPTPIERLQKMNQPSIDLYTSRGRDIHTEPLEVAVCSQHNNGGFKVGRWWESTVKHLFFIGELAGTHGVKRPGGSALNSGQVGALRAAEYIACHYYDGVPSEDTFSSLAEGQVRSVVERVEKFLRQGESSSLDLDTVKKDIQHRMTGHAAHIRRPNGVREAVAEATALRKRIEEEGLKLSDRKDFLKAWQLYEMALTSEAYLSAIQAMIERGGGSRGSHLVVDEKDGIQPHPMLGSEWNFMTENTELRSEILEVKWDAGRGEFATSTAPTEPIPEEKAWFENTWEAYRSGKIYE